MTPDARRGHQVLLSGASSIGGGAGETKGGPSASRIFDSGRNGEACPDVLFCGTGVGMSIAGLPRETIRNEAAFPWEHPRGSAARERANDPRSRSRLQIVEQIGRTLRLRGPGSDGSAESKNERKGCAARGRTAAVNV